MDVVDIATSDEEKKKGHNRMAVALLDGGRSVDRSALGDVSALRWSEAVEAFEPFRAELISHLAEQGAIRKALVLARRPGCRKVGLPRRAILGREPFERKELLGGEVVR